MKRTREITSKLLRDIISMRKLRGGLDSKTSAVGACVDLLAAMRLRPGRAWTRDRVLDKFVAEQRKIAGDTRLGPGVRVDAMRRLCVLGGWAASDILGDGDADHYTCTLIAPKKNEEVSNFLAQLGGKPTELSDVEKALAKFQSQLTGRGKSDAPRTVQSL